MIKEIETMTRKELWAAKDEVMSEKAKNAKMPVFVRAQFSNALEARLKRIENALDKCFFKDADATEVCRRCSDCREHYS